MNINDLVFNDEEVPTENIAELSVGRAVSVTPQPGFYNFTIPENLENDVFTLFYDGNGYQRVAATVELRMADGNFMKHRFSNLPTLFLGGGDQKVSELALLLAALAPTTPAPKNSRGWVEAIVPLAGKTFRAKLDLDARCDPKRQIWKTVDGKPTKQESNGCGKAYVTYKSAKKLLLPKDGDKFKTEFLCECGANLRVFPRLVEFWGR